MGYYSNLSICLEEKNTNRADFSYPSPESQLDMRIDDLILRLPSLRKNGVCTREELLSPNIIASFHDTGEFISDHDIRYVLPEHIKNGPDVNRALRLAISDYMRLLSSEQEESRADEDLALEEGAFAQMSIWDSVEDSSKRRDEVYIAA